MEKFKPFMSTASSASVKSLIRKVENEFVGGRYWGSPALLVIEGGNFTNMSLFLFVKDFHQSNTPPL
jgi:hypothetical protein